MDTQLLMSKNFQQRLKVLLKDRKITAYRLHKDLGFPMSTVQSWIDGSTTPRDKRLKQIADYLHVNEAWLRYGDFNHAPNLNNDVELLCNEVQGFIESYPNTLKTISIMLRKYMEIIKTEENIISFKNREG